MRSLTGLFLMLTGLAVGAHAYYPATVEKHVHIAQLARVISPAVPISVSTRDANGDSVRTFSPGSRLLSDDRSDREVAIKTVELPASPILNTAPKLVRTDGWQAAVVRTADRKVTPTNRVLSDAERWRLVRDVQKELRRAGCYWGKLDGSWGAGSKYAIQEFMLQVNASLPTTQPEPIMLTLLQSHPGTVCGKSCQAGYTKSANGRCLPYAITAQKRPEPTPKVVAPPARLVRSGTTDAAVAPTPRVAKAPRQYPAGRMAVGGPVHRINPRASDGGLAAPALVETAPRVVPRAKPAVRAVKKRKAKAQRKKARKKYRSASRKKARRKALIRQAFGEGFD